MYYFDNELIRQDIRLHAEQEYPKEACGVVVNVLGKDQYFACKNISNDPEQEFIMCPNDMTDAMELGELVAVVHSHPDATSRPSDYDLAQMERIYASEKLLEDDAKPTPWVILSWPEGDFREIVATGQVPLIGRKFIHGLHDCWQTCADYYHRRCGLIFPDFERKDNWWEDKDAVSHYEVNFKEQGFYEVDISDIQVGDMVVMQIGRSYHPNHAGIYLGSEPTLPGEEIKLFGQGPFFLHHMYGRKSGVEIFGGQWLERKRLVLRHKDFK